MMYGPYTPAISDTCIHKPNLYTYMCIPAHSMHTHITSFTQPHPHCVSVPDSLRVQTVTLHVLWCFIGRKPLSFLSVFQGSAPKAHIRA